MSSLTSCHSSVYQSADFDMNEQIKTWWDNESHGSRVKVDGQDQMIKHSKLWKRQRSVKMTAGMSWNFPCSSLSNIYRSAVKQFLSLENRLAKNPDLNASYSDTIKTDQGSGFFRILEPTELQETRVILSGIYPITQLLIRTNLEK